MCNFRIGHGYDVHRLVADRKLILGGVEIAHDKGLLGHSDADVLVHAVMDAIIGAMGIGDIGKHFPDSSEEYKGISSLYLLAKVHELMMEHSYAVVNIDTTIIAQKPKLMPHIEAMKKNIASILNIDSSCVNIKATTEERLGFTGAEEGIAAHAVVMLSISK